MRDIAGIPESPQIGLIECRRQLRQPLFEINISRVADMGLLPYLNHVLDAFSSKHAGGEIAISPVADNRHNDSILDLVGHLQCSGNRPT